MEVVDIIGPAPAINIEKLSEAIQKEHLTEDKDVSNFITGWIYALLSLKEYQ